MGEWTHDRPVNRLSAALMKEEPFLSELFSLDDIDAMARALVTELQAPTEAMRRAAYDSCEGYDAPLHDEMECNDLRWKAMIETALSELSLNPATKD